MSRLLLMITNKLSLLTPTAPAVAELIQPCSFSTLTLTRERGVNIDIDFEDER